MLLKGFLLGIALSAPIGVIGIWCIERSINYGLKYGVATGLGAVVADMIFAILAVFGFAKFIGPYIQDNPWPNTIGAMMVVVIGVSTIRKSNAKHQVQLTHNPSMLRAFMMSFMLVMTHPAAILIFLAIFTGLNIELNEQTANHQILQLLTGLFAGGTLWWFLLSSIASVFGKKMTPAALQKFNRLSGMIVIGFGIWLGISAFR